MLLAGLRVRGDHVGPEPDPGSAPRTAVLAAAATGEKETPSSLRPGHRPPSSRGVGARRWEWGGPQNVEVCVL